VVPHGVAAEFSPAGVAEVDAVLARLGIGGGYLLPVGTFAPRKRGVLLRPAAARPQAVPLVVAGDQGTYAGAVATAAAQAGVAERTVVTGHLPLADLVALYSGAGCLLFTS